MKSVLIDVSPSIESMFFWFLKRAKMKYTIIYDGDESSKNILLKDLMDSLEGITARRLTNVLLAFVPRYYSITVEEFIVRYSQADLLAQRACGKGCVNLLNDALTKLGYKWQ